MTRHRAGALDELGPHEVWTIPLDPDPDRGPLDALVLRDTSGRPRAYRNRCTHLPIPIDAGSGLFFDDHGHHLLCRTHGARFRREDGLCIAGPCPGTRLTSLAIDIEDGIIYVLDERAARNR